MKKFKVRYYECYERFYEIEANSKPLYHCRVEVGKTLWQQ